MKATPLEYRYRFWAILAIYILGFTAPWNIALHLDGRGANAHVWGLLAALLTKATSGGIGIGAAFNIVLAAGILCGLAGALLRTWGAACLGVGVVQDMHLRADTVVASGPFRHVRNPLYLGLWIFTLLLTLLMPASGAVFTLAGLGVLLFRLILAEEEFLTGQQGESYTAYCASVPRLLPALRAHVASAGGRPRWAQAFLAEIFLWGTIASFAAAGWRYNTLLLMQCLLVWFGVMLIVRALAPGDRAAA